MFKILNTPSDDVLNDIAALYCEAFNAPDKGEDWSIESAVSYFQEAIISGSFFAVLYDDVDQIQAFVFGAPHDAQSFYLSQFVVAEGVRGTGIGRSIFRGYCDHVQSLGFGRVIVRCRFSNDVMCSLLQSEGCREVDRYESKFGGVTCTRVVFEKILSSEGAVRA